MKKNTNRIRIYVLYLAETNLSDDELFVAGKKELGVGTDDYQIIDQERRFFTNMKSLIKVQKEEYDNWQIVQHYGAWLEG